MANNGKSVLAMIRKLPMPCTKERAATVWKTNVTLAYQRLWNACDKGQVDFVVCEVGRRYYYPTVRGMLEMRDQGLL